MDESALDESVADESVVYESVVFHREVHFLKYITERVSLPQGTRVLFLWHQRQALFILLYIYILYISYILFVS